MLLWGVPIEDMTRVGGEWLVAMAGEVYRVDAAFAAWHLMARLQTPLDGGQATGRATIRDVWSVPALPAVVVTERGAFELGPDGPRPHLVEGPRPAPPTPRQRQERDERFGLIATLEQELAPPVFDVLAWRGGGYLVATAEGLILYDPTSHARTPPPFKRPEGTVRAMACDRGGWLWLGATGVWVKRAGVAEPMAGIAGLSSRHVTWIDSLDSLDGSAHAVAVGSRPLDDRGTDDPWSIAMTSPRRRVAVRVALPLAIILAACGGSRPTVDFDHPDQRATGASRKVECVRSGGVVACRGLDERGLMGTGRSGPPRPGFVAIEGLRDAVDVAVAVREAFACALRANREVWCWGTNLFGVLGDRVPWFDGAAPDIDRSIAAPGKLDGLPPVVALAVDAFHACAIATGGAVYCWVSTATVRSPIPVATVARP